VFLLLPTHSLIYGFKQARHVAQTKQPLHKAACIKRLKILKMLTRAKENDWALSGCNRAQRSTTLGMAIKLCNDHRPYLYCVFKSFCLSKASLADAAVHHEDACVGLDCCLHFFDFIEQCLLLLVAT
jgi:hypothetical protein